METQHEFIERRRQANEEAAREAENDWLIQMVFAPAEPMKLTEAQIEAFCYRPGFMTRRQGGDPIDAAVSCPDTVTEVSESEAEGAASVHHQGYSLRRFGARVVLGCRAFLQRAAALTTLSSELPRSQP